VNPARPVRPAENVLTRWLRGRCCHIRSHPGPRPGARAGPGRGEGDHTGEVEPGPVSPREREVLALLGRQLTHEEIGRRLFISVRTVESHVASLRRKLDLPDHRALVRYATVHADDAGSGLLGIRPSAPLTSFVGRGEELAALQAA